LSAVTWRLAAWTGLLPLAFFLACTDDPDFELAVEREADTVRLRLSVCLDQDAPLRCSDEGTVFEDAKSGLMRSVGVRIDDAFTQDTFRLLVLIDGTAGGGFERCDYSQVMVHRLPTATTLKVFQEDKPPTLGCVATADCSPLEACQ